MDIVIISAFALFIDSLLPDSQRSQSSLLGARVYVSCSPNNSQISYGSRTPPVTSSRRPRLPLPHKRNLRSRIKPARRHDRYQEHRLAANRAARDLGPGLRFIFSFEFYRAQHVVQERQKEIKEIKLIKVFVARSQEAEVADFLEALGSTCCRNRRRNSKTGSEPDFVLVSQPKFA